QMLPRLGMNYCILPNLDKGATKIDILFQQNKYPVQEFMVRIPETGSRAFLLERINDRQFALKDMQSGTFLIAGNKIEEDIVPEMVADAGEDPLNEELPAKTSPDGLPPFTAENEAKTLSKKAEKKQTKEEEPRFLSGIEFNVSEDGGTRPAAVSSKKAGCAEAMNNEAFERYALRIVNKEDDDAMLKEL